MPKRKRVQFTKYQFLHYNHSSVPVEVMDVKCKVCKERFGDHIGPNEVMAICDVLRHRGKHFEPVGGFKFVNKNDIIIAKAVM